MEARSVLITGTTSGVGRSLLEHYARRGASIVAVNRRRVPELESRFPSVRFEHVDVRDADSVQKLVEGLAETSELPDLFLLNAAINLVDNDESFELAAYKSVIDTNLYGVLHFIGPLTRLPAGQIPRHVVAISSMAHYVGNPYGLGYFTSKRALTTCFDVWSRMYSGTDLVFQQVLLGPVPSSMYRMDDQLPAWVAWIRDSFSGSLDGTVLAVSRFALTRRKKLFHPWQAVPLYLGMWLGQRFIPGFFRGCKTLKGKARRRSEPGRDAAAQLSARDESVRREAATHGQG